MCHNLAPRILDSLKPVYVWDKFPVYQWHKWHTPVISIGAPPQPTPKTPLVKTYPNPIKEALRYKKLLDDGEARSQGELARIVGVSRPRIIQMLNLLKLDEEIQCFVLSLDSSDERLKVITERRLRPLVQIPDAESQRKQFVRMTGIELKVTQLLV